MSEAAVSGSRRDLLSTLRDRVASEIDGGVPARDLAALSRRLMEITREIESLDLVNGSIARAARTPDEPFNPDDL